MDQETQKLLRDFGIDPDRPIEEQVSQPGPDGANLSIGVGRNVVISNNVLTGYRPAFHAGAVDGLHMQGNRITELPRQPAAPKRPWWREYAPDILFFILGLLADGLVLWWLGTPR